MPFLLSHPPASVTGNLKCRRSRFFTTSATSLVVKTLDELRIHLNATRGMILGLIALTLQLTSQSCCEFEPPDTVHISSCYDVVALCQRVPLYTRTFIPGCQRCHFQLNAPVQGLAGDFLCSSVMFGDIPRHLERFQRILGHRISW